MSYFSRLFITLAIMLVLGILVRIIGKKLPMQIVAVGLAAYAMYNFYLAEANGEIRKVSEQFAEWITPKLQVFLNQDIGKKFMHALESVVAALNLSISALSSIEVILKFLLICTLIWSVVWLIWRSIKKSYRKHQR